MNDGLVTLHRQNDIAVLSLNRPERHNSLIPEMLSSLLCLLASKECRDAPVVMLRAEGRSFSTGGDLQGFQQHRDSILNYSYKLVGLLNEVIVALYSHPVPVICAVQGQVTGGSLGLLLAADRVVMDRSATITPWYTEVGFSPDGGWVAILPLIIGRRQAANWVYTNASYDADTCLELGLVHQLVDTQCEATALAWAARVAMMNTDSIKNARQQYNPDVKEIRQRLETERLAFVRQAQTKQALDGIENFLRKHDHE